MTSYGIEVPKATILVVDDNPDVLQSMAAVLEVLHEEVLTASNADQALKYLLKIDPAVIVLDVMMPEMDGFQLANLIRKRERFKHTPIIFLTGLGKEDSQMLRGYQAGAVDYLLKPVDPDVLRSKVRIFVELAKKSEMLRKYGELMRANSEIMEGALADTLRAKEALEREIGIRTKAERTRDRLAGQLGATPDFVSAMAEGAVTLAKDGSILYCNARFAEMLQQPESELISSPIEACITPSFIAPFSALFAQGRIGRVTAEIELRSGDGEQIPVQVAMNPFSTAEIEAVAMVITDLRHQKRTEQMFAEGRLARLLLEHANSGMAVCDEQGRIILASRSLEAICGTNLQFRNFDEALPLELVDGHGSRRRFSAQEVLGGSALTSAEVAYTKPNGRQLRLLMSAGRIVSDNGQAVGGVITLLDISERMMIEEALRKSEKLAAAGRIAGTLAHEINNPLSAVTNLLYLLQNSELDEIAQHYVDVAASELARVSHIARNTLSFYREAASPVPVRLSEVLDSVLELYTRQLADKSLNVTRRYEYEGEIQNFPGELRQVFSNLVLNAIDALPSHGALTLSVKAGRHHRTGARGVRVVVVDQGTGIPPDYMAKLFEPFFTTKGERGTGLGLWVSHGIIQKQGGNIRVRSSSKPGRSFSVFSVFVPSVVAMELLHRAASASHAKAAEGRTFAARELDEQRDGTLG
jgi:PAS domain S-box-containing protein